MIRIKTHKNFSNWLQVFSFGKMVNEFTNKTDAIELAMSLAKTNEKTSISVLGEELQVAGN